MEDYQTGTANDFAEAIRAPYRAAVNIAWIVQERNINFYQTLIEDTRQMLREPTMSTYQRNVRSLSDQRIKQREAIGAVANEATNACLDLLYAPFYYLRGE